MITIDLPDAIIVDLDGALALFDRATQSPYDRDFSQDKPNKAVQTILDRFWNDTMFIVLTGRKQKYRQVTRDWLWNHETHCHLMYMRGNDDQRKDEVVKEEMYNTYIKDQYNIIAVFDDRLNACRLWHRLGLPLFRVGDPDANY